MADSDDFRRGVGTYVDTGSVLLGGLDYLAGESPGDEDDTNIATAREGFSTNLGESTTDLTSQQTNQGLTSTDASSLTNQTSSGLSQTGQTTSNTGQIDAARTAAGTTAQTGTQTGVTGTGAFTGQTGLGTSGYDPTTGQFSTNLAPQYQQGVGNALEASNQAYGALSGMDFNTTMGQRYNALEALQEQDRLQAQLDMEDRLFSQGRLGSTGGSLQQNALMDAIAQQQSMNANTAFGQAMSYQDQNAQLAQQFAQAGLAPQQLSLNQLQAMGALAPQISDVTSSQTGTTQDIINSLTNSSQTGQTDTLTNYLDQAATNTDATSLTDTASTALTNSSQRSAEERLAFEASLANQRQGENVSTPLLNRTFIPEGDYSLPPDAHNENVRQAPVRTVDGYLPGTVDEGEPIIPVEPDMNYSSSPTRATNRYLSQR